MSSPASEIVVSAEPPPSSPLQTEDKMPTPEEMPVEPPTSPHADPNSKKSFKRKYRKLLNKYLKIRAINQNLHVNHAKSTATSTQLSNENANLLDFIISLHPSSPPASPPEEEDFDPPSPSKFVYDAHFGYSPTPSPPPEVANQLTQEQTDMGMFKVEPGPGISGQGNMGPPQPIPREEATDTFKRGGARGARSTAPPPAGRKRKDRDSEGEDNTAALGRKKTRG